MGYKYANENLVKRLTVRLPEKLYDQIMSHGGAQHAREILEDYYIEEPKSK